MTIQELRNELDYSDTFYYDEAPSCRLCHAMPEHDPDVILRNAGLPQSDLHVCSRCDGSWQHQTDKREAWLAEESDV